MLSLRLAPEIWEGSCRCLLFEDLEMLWFGGFRFIVIVWNRSYHAHRTGCYTLRGLAVETYMTSGLLYTRGEGGENTGKQNRKMDPGK